MTLSSSNNPDEEAAGSSSHSASTASTEVLTLPLGTQGEVFLDSDDKHLVTLFQDAVQRPPGSVVMVNSDGGMVGNVVNVKVEGPTNFMIKNINGNEKDLAESQKSVELLRKRFRYVFLPSTVVFLLLLLTISLVVFRNVIFPHQVHFPPLNPDTDKYISGFPVYSKTNWGALQQNEPSPNNDLPTSVVIISHTAAESCERFVDCANRTQQVQYSFLQKGYPDIGYNFLIGGDGGIYVGRGWEYQNSIRANSLDIAFIGNFNKEFLTQAHENATLALIREGVNSGYIRSDFKLIGENQTAALRFYSPGRNAVGVIKNWDHFYPGTML